MACWDKAEVGDVVEVLGRLTEAAKALVAAWDAEPGWATNTTGVCMFMEDLRAALESPEDA